MPPPRWRINESRSMRVRRLVQLSLHPSLRIILILWVITGYRSFVAYCQLAEELRPDNPLYPHSSTCLHIQIRLHLALLGHFLSLYLLYEIITSIIWPQSYAAGALLMPLVVLNEWYRLTSLLIAVLSFPVLVLMGMHDNVIPWISGLFAVFRAFLFAVCLVVVMLWYTSIVVEEIFEHPAIVRSESDESDIWWDPSHSD